jgi:hypothetical protein
MSEYSKLRTIPEDNAKINTIKQIKELMFIYFVVMSLGIKKVTTFDPSKRRNGYKIYYCKNNVYNKL